MGVSVDVIRVGGRDLAGGSPGPGDGGSGPPVSDVALLNMVRAGNSAAAGALRARHVAAAHTLACLLPTGPARAEAVVAESFQRIQDALGRGGGPADAFRPHLLAVVVAVASRADQGRARNRLAMPVPGPGCPLVGAADAGPDAAAVVRAFLTLPERWSSALWYAEIELAAPVAVAPLLGVTVPACTELITCARDALRTAYLQVYGSSRPYPDCRAVIDDLAAWLHEALGQSGKAAVDRHLRCCRSCWSACSELIDIGGALRGSLAPLVLGPAAFAYCARMAGLPAAGGH